jgi:hypothetical protein
MASLPRRPPVPRQKSTTGASGTRGPAKKRAPKIAGTSSTSSKPASSSVRSPTSTNSTIAPTLPTSIPPISTSSAATAAVAPRTSPNSSPRLTDGTSAAIVVQRVMAAIPSSTNTTSTPQPIVPSVIAAILDGDMSSDTPPLTLASVPLGTPGAISMEVKDSYTQGSSLAPNPHVVSLQGPILFTAPHGLKLIRGGELEENKRFVVYLLCHSFFRQWLHFFDSNNSIHKREEYATELCLRLAQAVEKHLAFQGSFIV